MDLFEPPTDNAAEFTVSELSGAVKRVIEGEFGMVRVRGEIGRVSRPASGHLYYDLKDDRSVIAAITWKGQAGKLTVRPEEGMEVIATGRMTTFPGQSKYQLIIEDIRPAGAGALMAMLEKRRLALAAEGLFDADRKRPLPWLPEVIGVVTSPSGAVIRDILHRLRDRFPRHVLIWPVAVQGDKCAPEVAAAIRGFNALPAGGPIPRPDLLIVARGGGSLEDLWGFNEEIVVRAAADSRIPLISAVGHETDTTLIDHVSDRRAPTPTAAAEMAVPVRVELLAAVDQRGASLSRCIATGFVNRAQRLRDLARALPRPETLTQTAAQRHDLWAGRLDGALGVGVTHRRAKLTELAVHLRPRLLADLAARGRERLADRTRALDTCTHRRHERGAERLAALSARLAPAYARALAEADRDMARRRDNLVKLEARLNAAPAVRLRALADQLEGTDRLRQTLGYRETLARGYAVIRGDGEVLTTKAAAEKAAVLEAEFIDGRVTLGAKPKKARKDAPEQGSLF
ncbi:exodeoxyribonuclease VII large subunit [Falsirhodobacter sp. 20TX0035]|uniref:exodeoxyribonuclease VII large subunit n=1 Tax=Falsirhodobacter sp. 20TX0035 TaxID=3022019 RepID=UPI002330571E|nr:exodeoxyribonuclease VII large subunit [Falsirhodobacter sp. 20TX0035]MDB6455144.1 exodeoxyribonuclease VII large subunit [Falsirhodobacter sp. 20TX0035]